MAHRLHLVVNDEKPPKRVGQYVAACAKSFYEVTNIM